MSETLNWYAVYTRPRWEKKVASNLLLHGVEAYCPVTNVSRLWGKRRSVVQEPLFKPYVFVRVSEKMKWRVLDVSGVLKYVTWLGKPAKIRDHEIETIKDFVARYDHVQVENLAFKPSMQVVVMEGAFSELTGEVKSVQ